MFFMYPKKYFTSVEELIKNTVEYCFREEELDNIGDRVYALFQEIDKAYAEEMV